MKKLLIIALLIVGVFAQETEMSELEKQMIYKQNDKSPLIAGSLNLIPSIGSTTTKFIILGGLPALGHAYMGEWRRGFFSGFKMLAFAGVGLVNTQLAYGIYITGFLIQGQDAIYLANQHNADLYKEIYGKEYIRPPKKSLIQKWIDKKEAKKQDE